MIEDLGQDLVSIIVSQYFMGLFLMRFNEELLCGSD